MDLGISGKRAMVTGSTSGIGAATVRMLAAEGARVIVNGRNRERAEAVCQSIREQGGEAEIALGDLSTDASAKAVMERALSSFGGIDILINNLGHYEPFAANWSDATPAQWVETYESNVVAAVRTIQATLPAMKEAGWGRIINIASGAYTEPPPDFPTYGPSKAALVNLSVGLAKSLADTGITVNTISPGNVLTEALMGYLPIMNETKGWGESDLAGMERRFALEWRSLVSRTGRVEEIAALICFVASAHASYITGTNYRIDGGSHATLN